MTDPTPGRALVARARDLGFQHEQACGELKNGASGPYYDFPDKETTHEREDDLAELLISYAAEHGIDDHWREAHGVYREMLGRDIGRWYA